MRIGVQNTFPNRPQTAETQWIRRFFTACGRLGFEPAEVITSADIMRCQSDCVLVTHEFSPKLIPFPTLWLNWSPPVFFAEDPVRGRSILSLDGHLCGSRQISQWIDDFTASLDLFLRACFIQPLAFCYVSPEKFKSIAI